MCGRIRTEGRIRTIGIIMLLAIAATLSIAASASATPLDYTFDGNNEGWLQSQNNGNTTTGAGFQSSGGNPGGHLHTQDSGTTGTETTCPDPGDCNLLTFYSPVVPLLSANYGGTASFDLRSSGNPAFAAEFLLLPSGPDYLDGLIPEGTDPPYPPLSIVMDTTGSWSVCPYAGGICTKPTQARFLSLIAASDRVAVIADVGPNGTGEVYDLDNVVLTDGGPLPAPPPPGSGPPPAKPSKKPKKCKKK